MRGESDFLKTDYLSSPFQIQMEISQHFVTFIQTWPKISTVPYPEDLIEVPQSSEI